jgi:ribosome maturation factor RimP
LEVHDRDEKEEIMATEVALTQIENMINGLLEDMPGYFLVQVRIKPTNNVKVFLDGDTGITIETCIKINRKLYAWVEESQLFPDGDFSLEVSSPGLGEPLILHRQYVKNIGRWVEVKLTDGTVLEGELKTVSDDAIELETTSGKGKKAVVQQQAILFSSIKSTSVQIKF